MKPTAAPPIWPYPHRTIAQVDAAERLTAYQRKWVGRKCFVRASVKRACRKLEDV